MKLIPMTDFVLQETGKLSYTNEELFNSFTVIRKYAALLKLPIKLEMFVPCDERGNVLNVPNDYDFYINRQKNDSGWLLGCDVIEYQQAKERCLFEDFYVKKDDDGHLCLFHKNSEWYIAKIEPQFVWGRTNGFIIDDIITFNPRLNLYKLNDKY